MKTRAEVVNMVRNRIRLLHFAYSTEQAYCGWVARYYDFCRSLLPSLAPEKKLENFLTYLARSQQVSARTQNQALAAMLFLYKEVLRRPLGHFDALRAKNYQHERTAPSREQVRALRQNVEDHPGMPAKLLVDLLYGCGLRVSEPLELRIKDILWEEEQLVVRSAKGFKDRRVPVPRSCIEPLRAQIDWARQLWETDRRDTPVVGVTLPHQLGEKYPTAAYSWQWFWVFPASGHCADPRTHRIVRFHLLHDNLQRAVRAAAQKIQLENFITPHVLRHAYATHSRERIETLRKIMGHVSIETTSGYRHPEIEAASNPLDDLVDSSAAAAHTPPGK